MLSLNGQVMLPEGIQSRKLHPACTGIAGPQVSWDSYLVVKLTVPALACAVNSKLEI